MKKLMVFMVLVFTAVFYAQTVGPKLSVDQELFDFGTAKEGDVVKHSFVVTNTGDEVLEIKKVKASCGCTGVKPDKNMLEPGESTNIIAEFDTFGRKGPQTKYIYVNTNIEKPMRYKFTLKGEVEPKADVDNTSGPKLKLSKNQYQFGKIETDKVYSTKIEFSNVGNAVLRITDIKASCGCTVANVSKREVLPGEKAELTIEFDTTNMEGKKSRSIALYSNDRMQSVQHITLYANITK